MEVVIEKKHALPCSLSVFTINGVVADSDDFGSGRDEDPDSAEPYGCGDWIYKANKTPANDVLATYNITVAEYDEICDRLESELGIGNCSWCN